jgi:DNA-binding response OmpR family regulator
MKILIIEDSKAINNTLKLALGKYFKKSEIF